MIFSEAVSTEFFETADKITPPVKSPAPQWMQPDTRKAIEKRKMFVKNMVILPHSTKSQKQKRKKTSEKG